MQDRDYLLFRLEGVMASWGEVVAGELRTSSSHPTCSALLGLLGAALGVERAEDDVHHMLANTLHLATLVERSGAPIEDFHTTQTPDGTRGRNLTTRREELAYSSLATILSRRTYYCEQSMTVAIWINDSAQLMYVTLEEIAKAITRPKWTLYMGRKSCPLLSPPRPVIVSANTLREALEHRPPGELEPDRSSQRLYWDSRAPHDEVGVEREHSAMRRDVIHSRRNWTFHNRTEHSAPWPPRQN